MNNAFTQLCRQRYSCRAYDTERTLPRDIIEDILGDVRLAPSAVNRQPVRYTVVTDPDQRAAVAATYARPFLGEAPAIVIATGLHDEAWHRPFDGKDHTDVDAAIAIEHLCLAAAARGVGSCWICNFDPALLNGVLPPPPAKSISPSSPWGTRPPAASPPRRSAKRSPTP